MLLKIHASVFHVVLLSTVQLLRACSNRHICYEDLILTHKKAFFKHIIFAKESTMKLLWFLSDDLLLHKKGPIKWICPKGNLKMRWQEEFLVHQHLKRPLTLHYHKLQQGKARKWPVNLKNGQAKKPAKAYVQKKV